MAAVVRPRRDACGKLDFAKRVASGHRCNNPTVDEITDEMIVTEVGARVRLAFPDVDATRLTGMVAESVHAFAGAHVRSFVAVLVERQVTTALRLAPTSA